MLFSDESEENSKQNNIAETRLGYFFLNVFVTQQCPVVVGASSSIEEKRIKLPHRLESTRQTLKQMNSGICKCTWKL